MERDAYITPCGKHRLWLRRRWDPGLPEVAWIMLNPSTADASVDDPTIRRCVGFSKAFGCGSMVALNLFSYRATNPKELKAAESPDNPPSDTSSKDNDLALHMDTKEIMVIAAWGAHGSLFERDRQVLGLLRERTILCLGRTAAGHPRHPLYLPLAVTPEIFQHGAG